MGYDYIAFDDRHFREDLQYCDAVPMFHRLKALAESRGLEFGLKLSNTFPVDVKANELPSEEMYMSGRSLYPLTIEMANRFANEFKGQLRLSYSGGADFFNIKALFEAGIWPITMATTILKPGGYGRMVQLGKLFDECEFKPFDGVDYKAVAKLSEESVTNKYHVKPVKEAPERTMGKDKVLPLTDCFKAPCKSGCPFGQDIPEYVELCVKTLIREICDLFPEAPYLHIGGDEANISLWDGCIDCREYMKKNGIDDVYGLYSDYVARITKYVLSLGKTPIVWEGFPESGSDKIPKETIVISWENHYQNTYKLLSAGFPVINASWKPLYIVPANNAPNATFAWGAKEIFEWNIYNWQHWWEKSEATLNPVNVEPTDQVIGAMLCAWEMTFEMEISTVMANLAALAERTWAERRTRTFDQFRAAFNRIYYLASWIIQDR